MLNPDRGNAWVKHAAGAASMIELRGPRSYRSDLEQSLLMSHVSPMVSPIPLLSIVCSRNNCLEDNRGNSQQRLVLSRTTNLANGFAIHYYQECPGTRKKCRRHLNASHSGQNPQIVQRYHAHLVWKSQCFTNRCNGNNMSDSRSPLVSPSLVLYIYRANGNPQEQGTQHI
jgi:hypothetical protein